jgi:hypothetical protein
MGWVAPPHLLAVEHLHEQWQPDKVNSAKVLLALDIS